MPNYKLQITKNRLVWLWVFLPLLFTIYCLPFTTLHAQEVDLLWQGNTYTPPFYEGRALWSNQSSITIVAIPHIPGISNPSLLEYQWTKNSTVLGLVSGVGKNTITFNDSILSKPVKIKVDVLASDGALLTSQTTTLTPRDPKMLIYENNPLYGFLLNKEVGDQYTIKGSEVTLASFPLFFSAVNRGSEVMEYLWTTNSGNSESSNSVTYKVPEGVSGSSRIIVKTTNQEKIFQGVEKSFLIQFDNQNNGL